MSILLQIDFPYDGPFGEQMSQSFVELAESIAQEPGFIWKIWTENASEKLGGGIYLFATEVDALTYLQKHTTRLASFGISGVRGKLFNVNLPLSKIILVPDNCLVSQR